MDTQLRWGLLSTAHINRSFIPSLRLSKRSKLAAVASRTLDKAQKFASEWQIPKALGSYDELLADPDVDVIYISLPNSMHVEWTVKAVKAGKHVLCEKPIATSLDGINEIIAASATTGKVVVEAFMYRHHPQTLRVKELIRSQAIGKIIMMRGSFTFKETSLNNIRWNPRLDGGSLWDVGCYPINYARYLYGMEPFQFYGFQVTSATGVDQSFTGEMNFLGDVLGQFQSSLFTPYYTIFEIFGEKGHILIPEPFRPGKDAFIILSQDGNDQEIDFPGVDLYIGEIEDMENAILNNKQPRVSLMDSRANVRAILKFLESARTGTRVS
jgi:D-xylose 1-dehydrogenase (NADP+, D-xylono-1,5-lactone-forming)